MSPLVPYYFGVSVGNEDADQLKLIFVIDPQRPGEGLALEVQAQQFPFRAVDGNLLSSHKFHANSQRRPILWDEHAEFHRALLALQGTTPRTAVGCQIAPCQHLAINKKIVVQNRRGVRHKKRSLSRLSRRRRRYSFEKEFVVRDYYERTGAITPIVTNQLTSCCHLQLRRLTRRGRRIGFLQTRFNHADAVLLLDAESLGHRALAFDENSEGTRIDHLTGRCFWCVFLVAGRQYGGGG